MIGLAGLIALMGYSLVYYGLDQINHGNNSFFSLIDPFKPFTDAPKDGASGGQATSSASGNYGSGSTGTGLVLTPSGGIGNPSVSTTSLATSNQQGVYYNPADTG